MTVSEQIENKIPDFVSKPIKRFRLMTLRMEYGRWFHVVSLNHKSDDKRWWKWDQTIYIQSEVIMATTVAIFISTCSITIAISLGNKAHNATGALFGFLIFAISILVFVTMVRIQTKNWTKELS